MSHSRQMLSLAIVGIAGSAARSAVIDFEDAPARGLGDNAVVADAYADLGVTFGVDRDGDLNGESDEFVFLERIGGLDEVNAFVNTAGVSDGGEPGSPIDGDWFLRFDSAADLSGAALVLAFSTPVSRVEMDIYDLDEALDASWNETFELVGQERGGNLVSLGIVDGAGADGDARATRLVFAADSNAAFTAIAVRYLELSGKDTLGVGFDNIEFIAIPSPGFAVFAGILGFAGRRRP